ncbi:DUF7266 family protein [Halopelagius fulvigenes]|uniref:Secreted glycoprotein n=1 Tax=Halopelagius fulvigenes TaxID=1198324 RepID=A0ABD5U4G5_9EURY
MREPSDRRGPSLAAVGGTDRAVSTAIGYVLTLTITAMLVSGLLFAGGQFVENEREQVVREELSTLAEQVAASIADADRTAAGDDGSTVRVAADLPTRVAGNAYHVEVSNEPTPAGEPNRTVVTLTDTADGVSASVTLPTTHEAAPRTVPGGSLVVVVRDADGDGDRELVTTTESLSPDDPSNSLDREAAAVGLVRPAASDRTERVPVNHRDTMPESRIDRRPASGGVERPETPAEVA